MDIHKPKPFHGWREFLKEYAIIVVGVLTALAGEQGVEWLHWRSLSAQTERELAAGLKEDLGSAVVWIAVAPCDKGRIAEIAQKLSAGPTQWRALSPAVTGASLAARAGLPWVTPVVLAGPNPFWSHDAWETAIASGALSHMPRERVARYGAAYRRVDLARNYQAQSMAASNQLSALGFDGPLTAPERASYLNTLAEVEYLQSMAETQSRYLFQQADGLGVGLSQADVDRRLAELRRRRGTCPADVKLPVR